MPLPENTLFFGFRHTMTGEQHEYVNSMFDNQLTICNAVAGSGKTTLAVAAAKLSGKKLVYIFAPVEESSMGYRPGTQKEKELDYLGGLYSSLIEIGENPNTAIHDEYASHYTKAVKAWVYPRSHVFARGTNIKDRFVIIDEAQNFTRQQLRKVLTRIHDDCIVCMIGHSGQCDINQADNGFVDYIEHYRSKDYAKVCKLTKNFRGQLANDADAIG